jgi:hypothetical protein
LEILSDTFPLIEPVWAKILTEKTNMMINSTVYREIRINIKISQILGKKMAPRHSQEALMIWFYLSNIKLIWITQPLKAYENILATFKLNLFLKHLFGDEYVCLSESVVAWRIFVSEST